MLCQAGANTTPVVITGEERDDYFTRVLQLALSYHPSKNYSLQFHGANMHKLRSFELILDEAGVDIITAGTTKERESTLLPVRFPLLKGLNGWRIALINSKVDSKFLPGLTPAQFKAMIPGQAENWSDTKILLANGIHVEKGSSYHGLFDMLHNRRFDYFPRSATRIEWDFSRKKHLDIAIEPNYIIHYPTAYYFFVAKSNPQLARDIGVGLEQALEDGSFTRLYDRYYGEKIARVRKQQRTLLQLENPFLPAETPLQRKELWIDLSGSRP